MPAGARAGQWWRGNTVANDSDTSDAPISQRNADIDILKAHTARLMEHFDSVQIFVTRNNPRASNTTAAAWGSGNWYARYGQTINWINEQENRE